MFKKPLRVKRVRTYPKPKYPAVDEGRVLSMPKEWTLSGIAREMVKPVMPLIIGTVALTQEAGATKSIRRPVAQQVLDRTSQVRFVQQDKADTPYPIRRFTEKEIADLISELKLRTGVAIAVPGRAAPRMVALTEAEGRQILQKFFLKNGINFRNGVGFKRDGVDFNIDGYNAAKKLGFEFIPCGGEKDLTPDEIAKLDRGIKGENILVIDGAKCKLPNPRQVVLKLQAGAEAFLSRLYRTGALGRGKEINAGIRDLLAGKEGAAETLKKIGPEALWWLQRAGNGKLEDVVKAIVKKDVQPLLEDLYDDDLGCRDEAADKLIEMGAGILPTVKDFLKAADDTEVRARCKQILKALGE